MMSLKIRLENSSCFGDEQRFIVSTEAAASSIMNPNSIALNWPAMNAIESIARVCALQDAILSLAFKVQEFMSIYDIGAVTFYISGTFSIDDLGELQPVPTKISTYTIGPFESTTGEEVKVKTKTGLNLYGIVSVESATLFRRNSCACV